MSDYDDLEEGSGIQSAVNVAGLAFEKYELAIKRIRELETRIAELEAAQTWRPIETAPKGFEKVLYYWHLGDVRSGSWLHLRCLYSDPARYFTHWMPLPKDPKA